MISDDFIAVTIFSMEFFNHSVFGYFSKEIFPKKKDAASATIASALFPWIIFQSKSHHFLHVHASLHQIHNDTELHFNVEQTSRCLKITEKVSYNIASEASYVYVYIFENLKLAVKQCYQTGQF